MKITIKNLQKKIPIDPKRIKTAILKACSQEGIKKSGEVNICFTNNKTIRWLNLKYLGKDAPTDVIAFDLREKPGRGKISADIAISTDTALSNARRFHTSGEYELYLYVIHGVLHLIGYDDKTPAQSEKMEKKATSILRTLNITST